MSFFFTPSKFRRQIAFTLRLIYAVRKNKSILNNVTVGAPTRSRILYAETDDKQNIR